ncbi:MAG: carbonate dehydratase [Deltaproteobacteria bacterium HGW-Deltaproteobacteria-15]|nr:MAG: carbonate dehydratase [Deltaproteobacteria bacterium HGW-Deltaproteobacteria-15]
MGFESDQPFHHVSVQETLRRLAVHPDRGLDDGQVHERRERFGRNALTQKKGRSGLVQFLLQFNQPLVYILVIAAAVAALLGEPVDAAVIFVVVLVNAIVGYLQEAKAIRAIEALSKTLVSAATVIRDGAKLQLDSSELVPGDIVLLQSGDRVPADMRLIKTRDLQINESALTGESLPTQKSTDPVGEQTAIGDRGCMAFSSALVTFGTGTGVVVQTGDRTEVGRISEMLAATEILDTPLTRRIKHFSKLLLWVVLGLSAVTFAVGLIHGEKAIYMFMAAVALAVGAIPEGLPAALTVIMAIGVNQMANRRAIIRRLPAVETLGSTTVICSDKTGTLTQNQMTVQRVYADSRLVEVSGTGYAPVGDFLADGGPFSVRDDLPVFEILRCGYLCNDAEIVEAEGLWKAQGDPTEAALVSAAMKAGFSRDDRSAMRRLDSIPFESEHQYMATLHDQGPDKPRMVYLKGSLESVLGRCWTSLGNGAHPAALDTEVVQRKAEELAAQGLRVLAFARKELPPETHAIGHGDVAGGLQFLGLQSMMDPPRPEAAAAVTACQSAGIRVKMITGDHAFTAASIARMLGIAGSHDQEGRPRVVTSKDLETVPDDDLVQLANDVAVFARVSPEHKLKLVTALQKLGHVVAMTGDGVNDAPALRRADIGIAMALSGTEVAREAADMVLTDDNFASIEAAVEEGRGVFDNLQKFIVWTLPTNGGEALVLMIAVFLGLSLPILPVQILWINMTTAVFLGMMLAFEPKESGIMDRPPNQPHAPLLTTVLTVRIVMVSVLICAAVYIVHEWMLWEGATIGAARTASVAMIVLAEAFYLFNCRSFTRSFVAIGVLSNPWVLLGVTVMVLLQILFTYLPVMNRLFHSEPLPAEAWLLMCALSFLCSAVVGLEKRLRAPREERTLALGRK